MGELLHARVKQLREIDELLEKLEQVQIRHARQELANLRHAVIQMIAKAEQEYADF